MDELCKTCGNFLKSQRTTQGCANYMPHQDRYCANYLGSSQVIREDQDLRSLIKPRRVEVKSNE